MSIAHNARVAISSSICAHPAADVLAMGPGARHRRSVILSQGRTLHAPLSELRADEVKAADGTLADVEREYIVRVLRESGGVISSAAIHLGMPRTTLNALMHKLGISRKDLE